MNKTVFLEELRKGLAGLPQDDIDGRVSFYGEMIDDRIEEGMSEEEAVAGIGSVEEIVSQTVSQIPLTKLVKERVKPKRTLRVWEIVLIILGFPLWFSLLAAFFAVVLALYIVLWALIVALWAVELAFGVCVLAAIVLAGWYFFNGKTLPAVAMIGVALFMAGLSVFLFFGCAGATKGMAKLTKKIAHGIKSMFIRKG